MSDSKDRSPSQFAKELATGLPSYPNLYPAKVVFLNSGRTAVFDQFGASMRRFEGATHKESVRLLAESGSDWRKMDHFGVPRLDG